MLALSIANITGVSKYFPRPSIYFGDGPRDQKRIDRVE